MTWQSKFTSSLFRSNKKCLEIFEAFFVTSISVFSTEAQRNGEIFLYCYITTNSSIHNTNQQHAMPGQFCYPLITVLRPQYYKVLHLKFRVHLNADHGFSRRL